MQNETYERWYFRVFTGLRSALSRAHLVSFLLLQKDCIKFNFKSTCKNIFFAGCLNIRYYILQREFYILEGLTSFSQLFLWTPYSKNGAWNITHKSFLLNSSQTFPVSPVILPQISNLKNSQTNSLILP